jgi:hypothetical protein
MYSFTKMNTFVLTIAFIVPVVLTDPGIPHKINIAVPCVNETSNCGFNGECKSSGPVKICKCNDGYSTIDINHPCDAKGEAQTKMVFFTFLFGWSGVTCFMLGWTTWGIVMLVTCLNGSCCLAHGRETGNEKTICWGGWFTIAFVCIWLYLIITISSDNCVDDKGVACKGW